MSHEPPDPFTDDLRAQLEAALARAEAAEQKVKELEAMLDSAAHRQKRLMVMNYNLSLEAVKEFIDQSPPPIVFHADDGADQERARIREGLAALDGQHIIASAASPAYTDPNWIRRADALALVENPNSGMTQHPGAA